METKSTEEPSPRGSMSKFVMASAIVAGGAFAVAAFSSALGDTKRRRLDSWLPNTINASLTAFNIGFSALADANDSISNESVGTAAMPAQANLNEPLPIAAQPVESSTENSAHDAQEDVVRTGYALAMVLMESNGLLQSGKTQPIPRSVWSICQLWTVTHQASRFHL